MIHAPVEPRTAGGRRVGAAGQERVRSTPLLPMDYRAAVV
jgi:hypothetical protein